MSVPSSLQMVGSKALGGAERWFLRFGTALAERGAPAELAIRAGSQLDRVDLPSLPVHRLPFLTVWDPVSRGAVARLMGVHGGAETVLVGHAIDPHDGDGLSSSGVMGVGDVVLL